MALADLAFLYLYYAIVRWTVCTSFSLLSKQESVNGSTDSKLKGHIYLMIKALGESLVTRQWRKYKERQVQER